MPGFGLATLVHETPSQWSMRVCPQTAWPLKQEILSAYPAAQTSLLFIAAKELSWDVTVEIRGVRTIDHREPSQCSARVVVRAGLLLGLPPTAQASVEESATVARRAFPAT